MILPARPRATGTYARIATACLIASLIAASVAVLSRSSPAASGLAEAAHPAAAPTEKASLGAWAWAGLQTSWRYTVLTSRTAVELIASPSFSLTKTWNEYGAATDKTTRLVRARAVTLSG